MSARRRWDHALGPDRIHVNRVSDNAHIINDISLFSALEGFSPTPEMPEIAEAQARLAAIAADAHMRYE